MEYFNEALAWFLSIESTLTKVVSAFLSISAVIVILIKVYNSIFRKQYLTIKIIRNTYDPNEIAFEAEYCNDSTVSLSEKIYVDTINPLRRSTFLKFFKLKGITERFVFNISSIDRTLLPYKAKLFIAINKSVYENALAGGYLWTTFRKFTFSPTKGPKKIIYTDTASKTVNEDGTSKIIPISRFKYLLKVCKFRLFGTLKFLE